jgi:hypothetical protein
MSAIMMAFLLFGCGDSADTTEAALTEVSGDSVVIAQIEADLNEALTRLRLGDKSGLYEMEFQYFTDETNFDDYLKKGEIQFAQADSLESLTIQSIDMFKEDDSARLKVDVFFIGPSGKESHILQEIPVYLHQGRWIKPTVSTRDHQDPYDELIKAAEADADL